MTHFQPQSEDSAKKKFKKLQNDLQHLHSQGAWRPHSFSADTKSSGAVRLAIHSENLDLLVDRLAKAGWEEPTTKGNWHVTLTGMTHKKFSEHDQYYKLLTQWFHQMPQNWAVVLVQCYKDHNGKIRFQRRDGFTVQEWSPPPTPSPTPSPTKCWDLDVEAGHCDSPNVCVDNAHVGTWSVYVVPCDDHRVNDLYNIDAGWGGAHLTMTSFQPESVDSAKDKFQKFKKLRDDFHSKGDWRPHSFSAETKSSGVVRLAINSKNLDLMAESLGKAGWKKPTQKGNFHVALPGQTHKKFSEKDQYYKDLTKWFHEMPQNWAVVLVHCYKDPNGKIRFHRHDGYTVHERTSSEIAV